MSDIVIAVSSFLYGPIYYWNWNIRQLYKQKRFILCIFQCLAKFTRPTLALFYKR